MPTNILDLLTREQLTAVYAEELRMRMEMVRRLEQFCQTIEQDGGKGISRGTVCKEIRRIINNEEG